MLLMRVQEICRSTLDALITIVQTAVDAKMWDETSNFRGTAANLRLWSF
jgi:hypothetical protein